MRSPGLFVLLRLSKYLRKHEKLMQKQNELLEKLIECLQPKAPEPAEEPDLLYSDDETDAIEEFREELKVRGYKTG